MKGIHRMKAIVIRQWGQPFQLEEVAQPVAGDDQVLVRVHAASLNPVDALAAAGHLQSMQSLPFTLGTDFAGEVVSVGSDVMHVKPGDAVYGMIPIRGGAFAEYAAPKSSEVALKPTTLDYIQAAAVPLPVTAAWKAVEGSQLQSGERVLIHGAGGAVGSFALQLATVRGAYIIASDLPEKTSLLQEQGADEILDAQVQRFEDVVKDVDVVLNFATTKLEAGSYAVLKAGGRYATTLQVEAQAEADQRGIQTTAVFATPTAEMLSQVAQLIDSGKVKVLVQRTFPLSDVKEAMAYQQSATQPGKIALTVK
jgi:NADPH:quinone reductase-like Zn-dependent oxidoreductase